MSVEMSGQLNLDGRRDWWSAEAASRLKSAVKAYGSQQLVADKVGIQRGTLSAILSGSQQPKAPNFLAICQVVGVDPREIMAESTPIDPVPSSMLPVPIHDVRASGGSGVHGIEAGTSDETLAFPEKWLRSEFSRPKQLRIVRVAGDSMEPTLSDGDWAMIDIADIKPADAIFVLRWHDMIYVKRVQREGRQLLLVSDNPAYKTIEIDLADEAEAGALKLIGRVVWGSGKI